jgi:transcriptional regulator with XRE-family HTH domain
MTLTPKKKANGGPTFSYGHYHFRKGEQDPIIDKIRTIFADHGQTIGHVADDSGVSPATLSNWFNGKTMKPQFATTAAVVRAMGYDFVLAPIDPKTTHDAASVGQILKRFPTTR